MVFGVNVIVICKTITKLFLPLKLNKTKLTYLATYHTNTKPKKRRE